MRPISIRCSWNIHKFTEVDDFGRISCERCGERKPVKLKVTDPDYVRNHMDRPKTKPGRLPAPEKLKPFVR